MFDAQMVFLKEFFEKVDFEKNQQMTKKAGKISQGQKVNNERNNSKIHFLSCSTVDLDLFYF